LNGISNINIKASPFGGEIEIFWENVAQPDGTKVKILKSMSELTATIVANYFSGASIPTIQEIVINATYNSFVDTNVTNGQPYWYALRYENGVEYSDFVIVNATPAPTLKFNVKDTKDIVFRAIKTMLSNIYQDGRKVEIGKDIEIVKNFSLEPIGENWIMLERVNGSTQYKFWANEIASIKSIGRIKGDIDVDVIRMYFITLNSSERRDLVYNLFKANKQVLIRLCKLYGAINCDISLEGDYFNPEVHGVNATGFIAVFSLLTEQKTLIPEEILHNILGELQVEQR
jgi:hypothetical protein